MGVEVDENGRVDWVVITSSTTMSESCSDLKSFVLAIVDVLDCFCRFSESNLFGNEHKHKFRISALPDIFDKISKKINNSGLQKL
jgi:hypothetical protein